MNRDPNVVLKVLIASAIILYLIFLMDKYVPILLIVVVSAYLIWLIFGD